TKTASGASGSMTPKKRSTTPKKKGVTPKKRSTAPKKKSTTPTKRWNRLRKAIEAAVKAPPDQRDRVLAEMCKDDPTLLSEVRSVMRFAGNTGGFLREPLALSGLPLEERERLLGRTLSHYRLEERLGSGGMSEVFRARDLALGRDAAVKVVPPHLQ